MGAPSYLAARNAVLITLAASFSFATLSTPQGSVTNWVRTDVALQAAGQILSIGGTASLNGVSLHAEAFSLVLSSIASHDDGNGDHSPNSINVIPRGWTLQEVRIAAIGATVLRDLENGDLSLSTLLDYARAANATVSLEGGGGTGVAAFARDPESSQQVWSAREGYPGDRHYRDFYRDIGFDLPLPYIGPYLHPDGHRSYTGIKYHAITHGELHDKWVYDPAIARQRAGEHAAHFRTMRQQQIERLAGGMDRPPIVVSP